MPDVDAIVEQVLARLGPVLGTVVDLGHSPPPDAARECWTVQDVDALTGYVTVSGPDGVQLQVECAAILPTRGERVWVEWHQPMGAAVVGRMKGQPWLLGGGPAGFTASPGTAGVFGLDLGLEVDAVVQAGRCVLVTGHCRLNNPSAALTAHLDVYDDGVLVERAAETTVAASGTGTLHGAVLMVGPTEGLHPLTLNVGTAAGTVDVQGTGWLLVQDVGSANLAH